MRVTVGGGGQRVARLMLTVKLLKIRNLQEAHRSNMDLFVERNLAS